MLSALYDRVYSRSEYEQAIFICMLMAGIRRGRRPSMVVICPNPNQKSQKSHRRSEKDVAPGHRQAPNRTGIREERTTLDGCPPGQTFATVLVSLSYETREAGTHHVGCVVH